MSILDDLIDVLSLLTSDRKKMQERGFPDEVIDKKRWRSCHPQNAPLVLRLREKYTEAQLTLANLLVPHPKTKELRVNSQLLTENILIPYIDSQNNVIKVRPHKMGFSGELARVYRTAKSFDTPTEYCIVAESEFKADAAELFGYPAVGIPGINAMSGVNLDHFIAELKTMQATHYVICFDNEVKDNPEFSRYKSDWHKRYDTIIWAYVMSQKMINAGLPTRIATLPAAWMIDGKIDIDSALAQKKTEEDFKKVIDSAELPQVYIKNAAIDPLHFNYVKRRISATHSKSPVFIKNNCFYIKSKNKDEEGDRRILNGSIVVKHTYEELGTQTTGVKRDLVVVDEYNMESRIVQLQPAAMASKVGFITWLLGAGNFIFYGTDKDLLAMWDYIFTNDDGGLVYLTPQCGYVREYNLFMFKNVAIKNAKVYHADDQGIFWIDDIGFKAGQINGHTPVPVISEKDDFDALTFVRYLSDTTDASEPGVAKALMGWVIAVMFLGHIVDTFKFFPLLFMYGLRSSGKTTILRWLLSFFGLASANFSLMSSSLVGITRLLEYYGNLPIVLDDWRDSKKFEGFVPALLGVYNRQSGVKGVKSKFGLTQSVVNGALAILGEEPISDNGLMSRCVTFYVTADRRVERGNVIDSMIEDASVFYRKILMTDYEVKAKGVVTRIKGIAEVLKTSYGADARQATNFAILQGSYEAVFGDDTELKDYIASRVAVNQREVTTGDKMHKFAEDFMFGVATNLLSPTFYQYASDGKSIYLWVKGICDVMNKYYNRTNDASRLIEKHFSNQPYFIEHQHIALRPETAVLPCIHLSIEKMSPTMAGMFLIGFKNMGAA